MSWPARDLGVLRSAAVAAGVVVPMVTAYVYPPSDTPELVIRMVLSLLLMAAIIGCIVRPLGRHAGAEPVEHPRPGSRR